MKMDQIFEDLNNYNKNFNSAKRRILALIEQLKTNEIEYIKETSRFSAGGIKTSYFIFFKNNETPYQIKELSNLENDFFRKITSVDKYIVTDSIIEKGDIQDSQNPFKI